MKEENNPVRSLLLIAHGSRREVSNDEIRLLTERLRARKGVEFDDVRCAFLELAQPSIAEGIAECAASGAGTVVVYPYFLSAGRHVATDIPEEVAAALSDHPGLNVVIASYLGSASGIEDMILHQAVAELAPA